MLALLIQSIYNIVDSYFVAQYSLSGLTALSIIFPIQLLMTALGTGTRYSSTQSRNFCSSSSLLTGS